MNPKEVMAVARVAESAVAEAMPGMSEKLALSLPEIFGPSGKHSAAKVFEADPADGALLQRLAERFQSQLEAFGLPHSAKPSELYSAAEASGLRTNFVGRRAHHYAGSGDMQLGDGTVLSRLVGAGRSGRTETILFRNTENSVGLAENYSSFFGQSSRKIGFYTPNLMLETALVR